MEAGPRIELRLLGRFVVLRDGAEVAAADFGGRKVRALLRILATRRGQFVPHDLLSEALWPDRQPADPAANLQVLVNRARKATGFPGLVRTGPGGYALTDSDECVVDAEQFQAAVRSAESAEPAGQLSGYARALAGWSGEPLAEDRYSDWAAPYREQLTRLHQETLEHAAALALRLGDARLAVSYATPAAAAEPLREVAVLGLVRALAAVGDHTAALARYERYRRALADELGLDPTQEATALQAQLLQGDRPAAAVTVQQDEPEAVEPLRFVGRDVELALALDELRTGSRVVTVAGASGSGKSRLVGEIARSTPSVSVHAYWPERSEPWGLTRTLLREVLAGDAMAIEALPTRLRTAVGAVLPELDQQPSVDVDPDSRRSLVIEAAVRLVSGTRTTVIVDDLQWADPTSVQVLAALLDRVFGLRVLLAYRPDEIAPGGPVDGLLRHLDAACNLTLTGLPSSAVQALVADGQLAAALVRHTDRSPLAVSELLRALARERLAAPDRNGRWQALTPDAGSRAAALGDLGQRRAIVRRASRHVGIEAELMGLVSLLAREVPARTLAAATGADEADVLDGLAALSTTGLVRLGERGWTTAHDMVAEAVAAELPAAESARMHRLLARALEAEGGDPAELARHWLLAGEPASAAASFALAAAAALDSSADAEAETLADAGLSAHDGLATGVALRKVRAQARSRRGDIPGARDDLRAALAGHPGGPQRATVLAQLAVLASGADDLVRAAELVELAIVEAGQEPAARAEALEVGAVLDMNLDRGRRARERSGEALEIYQRLGDSRGTARILDARAMAAFLDGNIRTGTGLLGAAANLFEDSGDLTRLVTPRSTEGHGLVFLDRPAEGLAATSAALEVARTLGHPEGQAYALWHRSEALSALGRNEEAVAEGREALDIAQRIGHRGWTATAWRAIGVGQQSAGDLEPALASYTESLQLSDNLDLFGCWAAARSAIVLVALRRLDEAEPLVRRAMVLGPPLGRYEARLAEVELAAARSGGAAAGLARTAFDLAEEGGCLAHVARLGQLAAG
jgi:DNA-binding SARP family transcriptional activator/tetratricopeptide (TPR) repeat protein